MNKATFSPSFVKKAISFFTFVLIFSVSFSQTDYTIQFQDETLDFPENINSFEFAQLPESSEVPGGSYTWVQFYETPSQAAQDQLKANNVELIDYIPQRTYLVFTPSGVSASLFKDNNARGIVPVEGRFKLSENLKNGNIEPHAIQGDNLLVTLEFHKTVSTEFVINDLRSKQISVKQQYKGANLIDLIIPNNCLEELSNLAYVKWVELIVAPSIPDDTRGRSLHRSNGLDTETSVGRNYTGEGIGVMVRDDGIVGPHIDYQGRIDNSSASGTGQTHGDGVGGIMAGAGNLDPDQKGMASGSDVFVVNYVPNFLDSATQNYINNGDVQITNSSYSNGCNDGYTSITRTVDQQTNNIPSLLHVFSAGNSNNNNCGYGAGNQWGNITGGHKQGKNVIATANVFFDGDLVNTSSRGPAHDGRIKPDIAANGANQGSTDENNTYQSFGGTSGAAPGIAGISAQLYELYGEANGGDFPPSALIKATLLNTANDAGNIGPDYRFGWGIVNGLRAGILLEDERYLSDAVSQGGENTHTISVPAGTAQVRFMVYWSDVEAASGANPSLVNDLDMVVTDPSNNELLPWILDPTPNPTTLNAPATNGEDHLNNVEQVLINNPDAGSYDIDISGFNVPMGPQEYYVVYEIIEENLSVTYPNDGESFTPGQEQSIHWDGINLSGSTTIEYSTDNGTTWQEIATVGAATTNYGWDVPSEITGEAKIRVTNDTFSDESDGNFSIAERVTGVTFSQVCPEDATITWTEITDAEAYDVYLLGEKYMEVVGTATTNNITVPIESEQDVQWVAVVAKNNTLGWSSRRTIAVRHNGGLLNCALANDVSVASINNTEGDFASVCSGNTQVIIAATLQNTGIDPQSNLTVSYQIDDEPAVEETFTGTLNSGQQVVFEFTTPANITTTGTIDLTVAIALSGDENPNNDSIDQSFYAVTEATALNFIEPFDTNGLPPAGWAIENADTDDTWEERAGVIGSDGTSTTVAYLNNFNYNAAGEEDGIRTEIFDLTNAENVVLNFDLAKAQYSTTLFDGLRVEVSIDCGETYTEIYNKTNLDLSTLSGYTTSIWSPTSADDWRTEEIDLTAYEGEIAQFRFINVNGYGNSTFIDNIALNAGVLGVRDSELGTITMYPNPAETKITIQMSNVLTNTRSLRLNNSLGQTLQKFDETIFVDNKATLDVSSLASGIYFVTIEGANSKETKKLIIK